MASFAALGDIVLAEPKALVGFAGPNVIKQTINAELVEILSLRTTPALLTAAATTVLFSVLRGYFGISTSDAQVTAELEEIGTVTVLENAVTVLQIDGRLFDPEVITIDVGQTVIWRNESRAPHTTTSGLDGTPDGLYDSGNMDPGATFYFTIE